LLEVFVEILPNVIYFMLHFLRLFVISAL